MNDEILKLAKDTGLWQMVPQGRENSIEAFYKAAFNAGLEAAARVAYGTGDEQMEAQIRALKEMK